jgi:hypothetical protein
VDDAIKQESDDDLYEQRGPRPSEIWAGWGREGNVDALWNVLVNTRWDRIDREKVLGRLAQALEVQSRADPKKFAAAVMWRMTDFTTTLLMRCHLHLAACVEQHGRDRRMRAQPPGDLPRVAVESLIPRTLELQQHLAALFVAEASIARQWSLVRKNEAKAGRDGVAKPRRKAGQEEARTDPDQPSARDIDRNANDSVADLRNSPIRGTNGVHEGV